MGSGEVPGGAVRESGTGPARDERSPEGTDSPANRFGQGLLSVLRRRLPLLRSCEPAGSTLAEIGVAQCGRAHRPSALTRRTLLSRKDQRIADPTSTHGVSRSCARPAVCSLIRACPFLSSPAQTLYAYVVQLTYPPRLSMSLP